MEGQVLGYNVDGDEGVVKGNDGKRYRFNKESWKVAGVPQVGQRVDFEPDGDQAKDIYVSADAQSGNNTNAIIGLLLTILLGAVGTLISRMALAQQNFGDVWLPALLHFCAYFLLIIPLFGFLAWAGLNIYFAVTNFRLIANGSAAPQAKYI